MPRRSPTGSSPDWESLFETARGLAGYFTVAQAKAVGFSPQLLQYHLRTGTLERAHRGIFRVRHFPPHELAELIVLWLWSAQEGVFSHTTALALFQLSDVLPSKVHLTLPASWSRRRLKAPRGVILHFAEVPDAERTWHDVVPVTAPLRTLQDCARSGLPGEFLQQASRQGVKRGLFTMSDLKEIRRTVILPKR